MKTFQRVLAAAILIFGFLLAAPGLAYLIALWGIEGRPTPANETAIEPSVLMEAWRACQEPGPIAVDTDNPWALAFRLMTNEEPDDRPGRRSVGAIARNYASDHLSPYASWHPSRAALSIWISRNWTAGQVAATVHRDKLCRW